MEKRRWNATWRRIVGAALLFAVVVTSAAYGFLVRDRHLLPYKFLARIGRLLSESDRPAHERHARKADSPVSSHEIVKQLASLPYLPGYRAAAAGRAIRLHDPSLAEDGLNFFSSAHAPVAILMDMDGRIVKTWTADAKKIFPGLVVEPKSKGNDEFLRDAELLPDGGIIGLFDQIGLVRLDANSRVVWACPGKVHHDVVVGENGEIWTLYHEDRIVPEINSREPIQEDFVMALSPQGKLLHRLSLVECFQRSPYAPLLRGVWGRNGDIFHTNSLNVLDGTLASRSPAFRRGNFLVSFRNLSVVAVVDAQAGEVVWALNGMWQAQHCAQFLPGGELLLFDNLGTLRKASRVLEVDPLTQRILWSFGGRSGEEFLSESNGFVERLPKGNTLITESNGGRAIEVTPNNRIVWEFVNPNRVGKDHELTAVVYFMKRVSRGHPGVKRLAVGSLFESRAWPPRGALPRLEPGGTRPRAAA
jgi:hypothetical protein